MSTKALHQGRCFWPPPLKIKISLKNFKNIEKFRNYWSLSPTFNGRHWFCALLLLLLFVCWQGAIRTLNLKYVPWQMRYRFLCNSRCAFSACFPCLPKQKRPMWQVRVAFYRTLNCYFLWTVKRSLFYFFKFSTTMTLVKKEPQTELGPISLSLCGQMTRGFSLAEITRRFRKNYKVRVHTGTNKFCQPLGPLPAMPSV